MILLAWVLMGTAYLLLFCGMVYMVYMTWRDKYYDLVFGGVILLLIMISVLFGVIGYAIQ